MLIGATSKVVSFADGELNSLSSLLLSALSSLVSD